MRVPRGAEQEPDVKTLDRTTVDRRPFPRLTMLLLLAAALGGSAPASAPPAPPAEPQGDAVGEEELETFVPSERLPADSAVAFPVDI